MFKRLNVLPIIVIMVAVLFGFQNCARINFSGEDNASNSIKDLATNDDDSDGLSDDEETTIGTDPQNPDTDGDGLTDGAETNTYGTDPKDSDTDNGGVKDGTEVNGGDNPLNPRDDDGEHPDSEENPHDHHNCHRDSDHDGASDEDEVNDGSDPHYHDSPSDNDHDGGNVNNCRKYNGKKTLICHIPSGNPGNRHNICVANQAVSKHKEKHDDTIGLCPSVDNNR